MRCVAAYIAVVAATHYSPVEYEDRKSYRQIKSSSEGAQELFKMVSEANRGMPLLCVRPSHVTTTDDVTVFAFEGVEEKNLHFE